MATTRVLQGAAGRGLLARQQLVRTATVALSAGGGRLVPRRGFACLTHLPDITADVGGASNANHVSRIARDFRSDTITMPTDVQLMAGVRASRGDSVMGEDDATTALEKRLAALSGKEAAIFVASGTMGNQLGLRATLQGPPHSMILDHRAHIHIYEAGGAAVMCQVTSHALAPSNGSHLTASDIEAALQVGTDIHFSPTRLIALENTMNGVVFPQDEILRISKLARSHDIPMHLDGARAWNVAAKVIEERGLDARNEVHLGQVLSELLDPFNSVSLCLSKGLGAPIGSVLVGSKRLIDRARWFHKMIGGGWRQSGSLAAAADYAVTHHFPRLAGTHELATQLADGLRSAGCEILAPVDTNMVFFDPSPLGITTEEVCAALAELPDPIRLTSNRCVVHHQTSPNAVDDFVREVKRLAGGVPPEKRGKPSDATGSLGYLG